MKFATLLLPAVLLLGLGGCSVNVIVAPGASLGIDSNNARLHSQTANQYNEVVEIVPVVEDAFE
jgi:hypothetical protein